ncbi:MAG: PAC2 family protein [Candidatus Bathyarchaeota archaeon]|nr:PAC2 family protein [Candidatus Bathyarchaeota archaeon]
MRSLVKIYEKLERYDPILVEGLPGIGFVSNILALHMIRVLKAKLICDIKSPYFQDISLVESDGTIKPSIAQLYLADIKGRKLLILYGNTQAYTPYGQYELCSRVLEVADRMMCRLVVCMGGYGVGQQKPRIEVYGTSVDLEWMWKLRELGVKPVTGRIYGVAGVLMAMAPLYGMKGICLLAETPGMYPDPRASRRLLEIFNKLFDFDIPDEGLAKIATYMDTLEG